MRKLSADTIIMFCIIGFVAWAIIGLPVLKTISDSHGNPSNHQTAENAYNSGAPQTPDKSPDKITDWLLVLFNGLLFGSTVLLWWSTRDAARGAETAARISERALVKLERPYIFPIVPTFVRTGTGFLVDIIVVNVGKVVGNIVAANGHFLSDETLPNVPPYESGRTIELDITSMPIEVSAPPHLDARCHISRFASPDLEAKYFFGYVRYDGIIEAGHRTWFCYVVPPDGGVTGATVGGPTYNGYD